MEGEARKDGKLVSRVVAFHVCGRVRLGIAELLRLFERVFIPEPLARHAREDIIGRTVDDARKAADDVRLQPV